MRLLTAHEWSKGRHAVTNEDGSVGYLLMPSIAKRQQSPFNPAYCYTAEAIAKIDKEIETVGELLARTFLPIYKARTDERAAEFRRRDPSRSSQ